MARTTKKQVHCVYGGRSLKNDGITRTGNVKRRFRRESNKSFRRSNKSACNLLASYYEVSKSNDFDIDLNMLELDCVPEPQSIRECSDNWDLS